MHSKNKDIVLKYFCFFIVFAGLLSSYDATAQEHMMKADSATVQQKAVKKPDEKVHSPRKATLYSAVFPGLGQIYNKKYWKVPLIYGGFFGFASIIKWNNDHYLTYQQAYSDITDKDPNTNSFLDIEYSKYVDFNKPQIVAQYADKLKSARDQAQRNRDMSIIYTTAFYALNIIDASVDAHFFNFDIGDDLSFVWSPETLMCLDQRTVGVRCRVTF